MPLLKALEGRPFLPAAKIGGLAGLAHSLTLTYWIVFVLGHYGNLSLLASIGPFLLLCAYLALFPALFAGLATLLPGTGLRCLSLAALWVALELVRAHLLSGFPWCQLGHSQYPWLTLIQSSDLFGVYGITFLIVSVNALIHAPLFRRAGRRRLLLRVELPVIVLALAAALIYGNQRLKELAAPGRNALPVRVAVIQAGIDQSVKWDPAYQEQTLEIYESLTRAALRDRPELVIWPETALPFFFQDEQPLSQRVRALAQSAGVPLIFGGPAYETVAGQTRFFNRAYLLAPGGAAPGSYDKVHLVPFGEYVPLKKMLFFIDRLVAAAGDFRAGTRVEPLRFGPLRAGVLICFEAIFPELAAAQVAGGANLLVNLTNDAWFGMTSAPHQHLAMSVFRAVETRRWLVRAANTGISALIGPSGEIRSRSDLFSRQVLSGRIHLSQPGLSFYARHGDLFALLGGCAAGLQILTGLRSRRREARG